MSDDLIRRSDAINVMACEMYAEAQSQGYEVDSIEDFMPEAKAWMSDALSADRPKAEIYGNEHNCIMTMFGECSYSETGCGDCAVVEKVRKALSVDRPQAEWILSDIQNEEEVANDNYSYVCTNCGHADIHSKSAVVPYCWWCGARMKGADNE